MRSGIPSLAGKRRHNKFNAVKTEIDGITFDSRGEAAYWQELKLRERAGEISDLKRQVTFRLDLNGEHICRYIADFSWREGEQLVVADFKGVETDNFKLKKKLFRAIYGYDIRIVTK